MATTSLNTPYILISGVALIVIVIVFTVVQPLLATIQDKQDQIATSRTLLEEKENFLRSLDVKRQELQVQRVHEERLNVILPIEEAYDDAIRAISIAATNAGVVIKKIENRTTSAESELNSLRSRGVEVVIPVGINLVAAQIEIVGTYIQQRAFLENLEKSPRLIDVLKISSESNPTAPDQITMQLLLQSYFSQSKIN